LKANVLESSIETQEGDAILAAAQAVIEKRTTRSASKNVRFDPDPARPFIGNPAKRAATTPTSASSNTDKAIKSPVPSQTPLPSPSPPIAQKVTAPIPSSSSSTSAAPQFSFKTPIEDPSRATELYSMILDTPIPGVTPRNILAASADVRKLAKEDTTTRKIPTVSAGIVSTTADESSVAEAFLQEFYAASYTARRLESLRSINLVINDDFSAECILDSGCQIIVI
jgi:hypothetical protein